MTGIKKFKGAPFGTQTSRWVCVCSKVVLHLTCLSGLTPLSLLTFTISRFDVSGVHPQNKMPGTYTQVPYCKKAMSKEVSTVPSPVVSTVPSPVVCTVPSPVVRTVPSPVVRTVPSPVVRTVPSPVVSTVPSPVVSTVPSPVVRTVPSPVLASPLLAQLTSSELQCIISSNRMQGSSQSVKEWLPPILLYSTPLLPPPLFGEFSLM